MVESRRLEFTDFTEWAQAAHDHGLWLFGTPEGSEAQSYPKNNLRGFWKYGTHKGWLEYEVEKAASGDSTT
jgi:hypothetical protein